MADQTRGSVFINCPFDEAYKPLFDAIAFAVQFCELLILDSDRFRYQRFASDLAGLDISEHRGDPTRAIAAVRHFLASGAKGLPTPNQIADLYGAFEQALPGMAQIHRQSMAELTFLDRLRLATDFVEGFRT